MAKMALPMAVERRLMPALQKLSAFQMTGPVAVFGHVLAVMATSTVTLVIVVILSSVMVPGARMGSPWQNSD
uniref:Col_cuticle_N domain-containing protein n=1 Tax=Panagrellus redivivus TaxID=6233 RepID=A0A7E4USX9_PANRE